MDEQLWQQFRAGDRRALSRLLSRAARGQDLRDLSVHLGSRGASSRVIAFTGSAGVGKSTLIGKLIDWLRGQGHRIGVLACDPQSPLSGGALLGDRFRMPSRADDDGVFIRSLAALSGHGAIADHLEVMVRLLEAFGFDIILIETVGAGQGDTSVHEVADAVVLLLQPETGDDLQWEKAGVLEVADMIVVHKADMQAAEQTAAQVRSTIELSAKEVPVLLVSSKSGAGIEELGKTIAEVKQRREQKSGAGDVLDAAKTMLEERFRQALHAGDSQVQSILQRFNNGELTAEAAGGMLLRVFS